MTAVIGILQWLGARTQWTLAAGVLAAFFAPDLTALLRPWLPVVVVLIYALSVLRMDLGAMAASWRQPARLIGVLATVAVLIILTPLFVYALARLTGISDDLTTPLIVAAVSPPIASAALFAFILRLDAVFALEVTMAASMLSPVASVVLFPLLLGGSLGMNPLEMSVRVGLLIFCGLALGALLRHLLTPVLIARQTLTVDGIAGLVMILFVLALFDRLGARILADPVLAFTCMAAACVFNFGLQALVALITGRMFRDRRLQKKTQQGCLSVALMAGNRNIAIYFAILPDNVVLALFVALYQLPMYFTPLIAGPLYKRRLNQT